MNQLPTPKAQLPIVTPLVVAVLMTLGVGSWDLGVGRWELGAAAAEGGLQRFLAAELARFPAKAGIYVKHLTTGEEAVVRGGETFNSASVIKIPVMTLAYQLAEQGKLDLDARVEMRKADIRAGSGVLRYHDIGLQPTVRDLITQMIITSDNTATDMAIAQVGGVAAVNAWLKANGYDDLRLNATIFEVFRRRYEFADASLKSLTPEELYALQSGDPAFADMPRERFEAIQKTMRRPGVGDELNRLVNEEPSTWLGQITPRGIGRLVESIETCRFGRADLKVGPYANADRAIGPSANADGAIGPSANADRAIGSSATTDADGAIGPSAKTNTSVGADLQVGPMTKASCAEMTRAFRRQQAGSRRLPHFLDVPVGHKTGDFPPVLANDVGVIYARSGPIVVAFLTNAIREPYAELEDRMGRTTRALVDYFDGHASGGL